MAETMAEIWSKAASQLDADDTTGRAIQTVDEADPTLRLPRHIDDGFRGVADSLDRRSRDWQAMVRVLEQQRLTLETAEGERDRLYEALNRIVPLVQESGGALKALLDVTKAGDISGDLTGEFTRNLRALDELENVAQSLTANFLATRSAWETYCRSVLQAHRMLDGA
jgi:hypothetical protein